MSQELSVRVPMPSMGEGVFEATLVKWLVPVGGKISAGAPLVEVSTDKVDTEIVSPAQGFVRAVFVAPGEKIAVGQTIAQIAQTMDAPLLEVTRALVPTNPKSPQSGPLSKASDRQTRVALTSGTFSGPVRATPLARKLAREQGIPLGMLEASGLGGRVQKEDVLQFMADEGGKHEGGMKSTPHLDSNPRLATIERDGQEYLDGVPVRREAMTAIRALTAEHMRRSWHTSPHVTTTFEIDLSALVTAKKKQEAAFLVEHGFKLTYTPFFLSAAVQALKKYPLLNASIDGNDILYKDSIHLGCAVAIPSGLVVPVIRHAEHLDPIGIAKALQDIVQRAHNKKLTPQDLQGGTFSVTNPGMYGSLHSQPIINQPQVAIMSIGAIVERPVVVDGAVAIRPLCQVGLTFDHRLVDGEGGAKFLQVVRDVCSSDITA